jgi:3-oxoisoapionate-4-phosphate decarboxylase
MGEFVRLTYLIETAGSPEKLAHKIASDQSTGTFVPVPGETEELKNRVAARVVAVRPLKPFAVPSFPASERGPFNRAEADIEFPFDAIGTDLVALMTIAIGGVFSIKGFTGIRIVDMKLPDAFGKAWPGPQFGIAGSRALTGVHGRPIIGTIVKPALGLRPHETAALVKDVIEGGADFVKDDESQGHHADDPRP